jgi:hypothetical protein
MSGKSKDFYYLLPGQGSGGRKRYIRNLIVGIIAGLIASGLLFAFFYLLES